MKMLSHIKSGQGHSYVWATKEDVLIPMGSLPLGGWGGGLLRAPEGADASYDFFLLKIERIASSRPHGNRSSEVCRPT